METTKEERDELRDWSRPDSVVQRLVNDADRLAAIERQVLWRTKDVPKDAQYWRKYGVSGSDPQCAYKDKFGREICPAPDLRPDEPGPLFLLILDSLEGS